MRTKIFIIRFLVILFISAGCSESLEDTYDEYTDGGRIRYVGKCYDSEVVPGWESLTVKWKRATDEIAENIKVVWSLNDQKDSTLLKPTASSFTLDKLTDGTYRFDITVLDNTGNESLIETVYGRPFTKNHEIVLTFTNVIAKSWQVGNKLVCRMDQWNDYIQKVILKYKNSQGEERTKELTKDDFIDPENPDPSKLYILEDVSDNLQDSVFIYRWGFLEGCPDEIEFDPIVVNKNKTYTSDFTLAIKQRYGFSDLNDEELIKFNHFIDTVRLLEFDYDINSLEDVLNCPNLEKIVIGKNRYRTESGEASVLREEELSVAILNVANKEKGVTIENYGNHYFESSLSYVKEMGYPILPDLRYVSISEIDSITSSTWDEVGSQNLQALLDDQSNTTWRTENVGALRTYDLIIHMKEEHDIKGIKIVQAQYTREWDWTTGLTETPYYIPSSVQVKTSRDLVEWEDVSYLEENTIGRGISEATLFPVKESSRKARYIKVTISDQIKGVNATVRLGDIMVYE